MLPALIAIGFLGMVLMWFVIARFWFAYQICMIQGKGAMDSMSASWNLTAGHWLMLTVIYVLLSIVCAVLAMLLFLPLVFIGAPLALGMAGVVYQKVVGFEHEETVAAFE